MKFIKIYYTFLIISVFNTSSQAHSMPLVMNNKMHFSAGNFFKAREVAKEEFNKALVLKALQSVFVEADPDALNIYWAENYIQHNPNIGNGRAPLKEFVIENRPPNFRYEIGFAIANGDYVAVQARVQGIAAIPVIAFDIFKVTDGKIVEHWDVLQDEVPASESVNGNAMFPIQTNSISSFNKFRQKSQERTNRAMVVSAVNRLFNFADSSVVDVFWAEDYIQHNPLFPNGSAVLTGLLSQIAPGDITIEIGFAMSYGDFVLLHSRYLGVGASPLIVVDVFRIEEGLIVEHWDVLQDEVPTIRTVSGNSMFPVF